MSKESRTSASKTFLTDMLHFSTATDKVKKNLCFLFVFARQKCKIVIVLIFWEVAIFKTKPPEPWNTFQIRMMRQNVGNGRHHSNAELVSSSQVQNEIPLASSTHLTVPSTQFNSVVQNNSGIQIKDSEIVWNSFSSFVCEELWSHCQVFNVD